MNPPSSGAWILLGLISASLLQVCHSIPEGGEDYEDDNPKLLYILLDGFRWDYLELWKKGAFPAFNDFLEKGVRAKWTNPIFPSLSYPNWATLNTGLYAENHNIIGNHIYDRKENDTFELGDSSTTAKPKWWTSAEPIWTTAEKAGLKTAQIKISRCDIPISNRVTHYCEYYRGEDDYYDNFLKSVHKVLKRFDEGYDFVQVYTVEPDLMGHTYGPRSEQVLQAIQDLDSVLAILVDELDKKNLSDKVNIIIVADHGMQYTGNGSNFKYIDVDSYLDTSLVEKITDRNGFMNIYVKEGNVQEVYNQLSEISGASAYKREDIPEEYHIKNAKYIGDILLVAHDGFLLLASTSHVQIPPRGLLTSRGTHGLSIKMPSMRGIFFAKGPAFRQGVVIDPIDLVDVYQVMTTVLDIIPLPNNGTWSHVESAFAESLSDEENGGNGNGAPTLVTSLVLSSFMILLGRIL